MGRLELRDQVRTIRSTISKRRREDVYGTLEYSCHGCNAVVKVGLATGVSDPYDRRSVSAVLVAQTLLDCVMDDCDGVMVKRSGSFSIDCTGYAAVLRVPSRRAAKKMIERGEIEPQLVVL